MKFVNRQSKLTRTTLLNKQKRIFGRMKHKILEKGTNKPSLPTQ